jgi:hypothetical protein
MSAQRGSRWQPELMPESAMLPVRPAAHGVRVPGGDPGRHSRKVVGWDLSRRLDASLALTALEAALAAPPIPKGVIHHPGQGVQYAAADVAKRPASSSTGVGDGPPAKHWPIKGNWRRRECATGHW